MKQKAVLDILEVSNRPMGLPEILRRSQGVGVQVPERTLRRWLVTWSGTGRLRRTGQKRGTKYRWVNFEQPTGEELEFTQHHPPAKRKVLLSQLRDLWTYSSLALAGVNQELDNGDSPTLADTHAILELGISIDEKSDFVHELIRGHARAIELLYGLVNAPLSELAFFELHTAINGGAPIQADLEAADYPPIGGWKLEPNYLSSVTSNGDAVLIEYAAPGHVSALMQSLISVINGVDLNQISLDNAHMVYAQVHLGIAHIAPFGAANGRIARLVSNILLLKAGLPPLLIDQNRRREYLELLADYQSQLGQLTEDTGIWPDDGAIVPFAKYCRECYAKTIQMFE